MSYQIMQLKQHFLRHHKIPQSTIEEVLHIFHWLRMFCSSSATLLVLLYVLITFMMTHSYFITPPPSLISSSLPTKRQLKLCHVSKLQLIVWQLIMFMTCIHFIKKEMKSVNHRMANLTEYFLCVRCAKCVSFFSPSSIDWFCPKVVLH